MEQKIWKEDAFSRIFNCTSSLLLLPTWDCPIYANTFNWILEFLLPRSRLGEAARCSDWTMPAPVCGYSIQIIAEQQFRNRTRWSIMTTIIWWIAVLMSNQEDRNCAYWTIRIFATTVPQLFQQVLHSIGWRKDTSPVEYSSESIPLELQHNLLTLFWWIQKMSVKSPKIKPRIFPLSSPLAAFLRSHSKTCVAESSSETDRYSQRSDIHSVLSSDSDTTHRNYSWFLRFLVLRGQSLVFTHSVDKGRSKPTYADSMEEHARCKYGSQMHRIVANKWIIRTTTSTNECLWTSRHDTGWMGGYRGSDRWMMIETKPN